MDEQNGLIVINNRRGMINFGDHVTSIQLNAIKNIGPNHWLMNLLMNRIEKLTLNSCTFTSNDFLLQSMPKMTELSFCDDFPTPAENDNDLVTIDLPECSNLKIFNHHGRQSISSGSLGRMIRQNPKLECLSLHNFLDENTSLNEIITLIAAGNLTQLRELALIDEWFANWQPFSLDSTQYRSFQNLESVEISVDSNALDFLEQMGTLCTRLNRLALHPVEDGISRRLIEIVCGSFRQIERLHLVQCDGGTGMFANFLNLFRECFALKTITYYIDPRHRQMTLGLDRYYTAFINTIDATRKPDAKILVKHDGHTILAINKNELTWADGYEWMRGRNENSLLLANTV